MTDHYRPKDYYKGITTDELFGLILEEYYMNLEQGYDAHNSEWAIATLHHITSMKATDKGFKQAVREINKHLKKFDKKLRFRLKIRRH